MIFNKENAVALRKRYDKAVENDEETFTFKGEELLTSYAKYLLEHLESNHQ